MKNVSRRHSRIFLKFVPQHAMHWARSQMPRSLKSARVELPFWIDKLDELAQHATLTTLRRRAFYEASVMRLRGLGTLVGQEERLRHFYAELPQLQSACDLEDAEVLLTYISTANAQKRVDLTDVEVKAWFLILEKQIDVRIRNAKRLRMINERCALLEIQGHVALVRQLFCGILDVSEALMYWARLAKLAVHAPLFPLERFADRLSKYARYIGSHSDYEPLTEAVDALVAERFGAFMTAEKCLQRADAFRQAGDLPRAMAQLHRAKIDWFAEETLGKSLLTLRWLSMAYEEQGLIFAAKYYVLAAAYVAIQSNDLDIKPFVVSSLELAAEKDYAVGAWNGFLELAQAAAVLYPHFAHDLDSEIVESSDVIERLLFYLVLLPVGTSKFHPELESTARERTEAIAAQLSLSDAAEELRPTAMDAWKNMDAELSKAAIEEQLAGLPWSDAGEIRRTQWRAHGVTWNVNWINDYDTTVAAEGFLAALQLFLSDLSGYDLCFLRSTIDVTIQLTFESEKDMRGGFKGYYTEFDPSNTQRQARVFLPSQKHCQDYARSLNDLNVGVLSVASSLLSEVSMLPNRDFQKILNERFSQGLQVKMLVGATYGQCFREFVSRKIFDESCRNDQPEMDFLGNFQPRSSDSLEWIDGPGPGYTSEAAIEQIRNRYDRFVIPIENTLERLADEPEFQQTVCALRSSGWKDWHILSAVFHVTVNYRLNDPSSFQANATVDKAVGYRMVTEPEPPDAPVVPLEYFSEDRLRQTMPIYMVSCLDTYGLEIHQKTPDFDAIEDFLSARYNFWLDDAHHEDPFVTR